MRRISGTRMFSDGAKKTKVMLWRRDCPAMRSRSWRRQPGRDDWCYSVIADGPDGRRSCRSSRPHLARYKLQISLTEASLFLDKQRDACGSITRVCGRYLGFLAEMLSPRGQGGLEAEIFGLGLVLGLMQYWPRSHEGCLRGLVVSNRNHVIYITFFFSDRILLLVL